MSRRIRSFFKMTAIVCALTIGLNGCIPLLDPVIVGTWLLKSVNGQDVNGESRLTLNRDKTVEQEIDFGAGSLTADGTWSFDRIARTLEITMDGGGSPSTSEVEGGLNTMTLIQTNNGVTTESEFEREGII